MVFSLFARLQMQFNVLKRKRKSEEMFVGLTQINDCVALLLVFSVSFMALCSAEMRYGFHISVFWHTTSPLMPRADGRSGLRAW